MKVPLVQVAEIELREELSTKFFGKLTNAVRARCGWEYVWVKKGSGYCLIPDGKTYSGSYVGYPNRNSFVPQIDVTVESRDGRNVLRLKGRPMKSVCVFVALIVCLALVSVPAYFVTEGTWKLGGIVSAVVIYLTGEFGTRSTFKAVVKAIREEFG